jgi:hypothetical protein
MRAFTLFPLMFMIYLSACNTSPPLPTATSQPTFTPEPTERLELTPDLGNSSVLTPTAPAEDGEGINNAINGLEGMYYEPDYLAGFTEVKDSVVTIGGEQVEAVVGVDASGQEETLAATTQFFQGVENGNGTETIKYSQGMVRVSEYRDQNGNAFYSFFNPDIGVTETGAFQLTPDAAEVIWERLFEELSEGQFSGMTPEEVKAQVLADAAAGKLTDLQVLRSIGGENPDLLMKTETVQADFSKPMEHIIIGSMDQFHQLPLEWQEAILDPDRAASGALFVGADKHLISVGVNTYLFVDFGGFKREKTEEFMKEYNVTLAAIRRDGSKRVGQLPIASVSLLSEVNESRAYWMYAKGDARNNESNGMKIVETYPDTWWEEQTK